MMNVLAHITPQEFPTGLLLFFAGFSAGVIATKLVSRYRVH